MIELYVEKNSTNFIIITNDKIYLSSLEEISLSPINYEQIVMDRNALSGFTKEGDFHTLMEINFYLRGIYPEYFI